MSNMWSTRRCPLRWMEWRSRIGRTGRVGNQSRATSTGSPFYPVDFFFSWMEWRSRIGQTGRVGNQSRATSTRLFLQPDGVKIKDRSNWSCGEPKSGYFNPKEEAFSWFKLHKNQVFWCLTWLRIKTDWRTWKEDRERKRGVTVRPTARSDLDL